MPSPSSSAGRARQKSSYSTASKSGQRAAIASWIATVETMRETPPSIPFEAQSRLSRSHLSVCQRSGPVERLRARAVPAATAAPVPVSSFTSARISPVVFCGSGVPRWHISPQKTRLRSARGVARRIEPGEAHHAAALFQFPRHIGEEAGGRGQREMPRIEAGRRAVAKPGERRVDLGRRRGRQRHDPGGIARQVGAGPGGAAADRGRGSGSSGGSSWRARIQASRRRASLARARRPATPLPCPNPPASS